MYRFFDESLNYNIWNVPSIFRCTLTNHQHLEEERPRRRSSGLQSGENFYDLGLDQPNDRQMQLIRRLGSEALLKGVYCTYYVECRL